MLKISNYLITKILSFKFTVRNVILLFFFSASFACWLGALALNHGGNQQFSFLARSFLAGQTYFIDILPSIGDAVYYNGHYFWPLGPGPALLLLPFVAIFNHLGLFFYQSYLILILVPLVIWLIYRLAQKLDYGRSDALYLAYAFCFTGAFFGIAAVDSSWLLAQVVTVALIFWSFWEFFTRRRYWLIGFIFGLIFLTRITAGLGLIFFGLDIFWSKMRWAEKFTKLFHLLLPILVALILLAGYNYWRFNDFWDQGYSRQILLHDSLAQARSYGLLSLKHLPGNLYYLFFSSPLPVFRDGLSHVLKFPFIEANLWGIGLFFLSPYLLGLFFRPLRGRISWLLLISAVIIAIPILLYYGIGWRQFGYRYALDFLPFIFVLFMINYRQYRPNLSAGLKLVIILSSGLAAYLYFGWAPR